MGAGAANELRPAGAEATYTDQSSSSDFDESEWVEVNLEDVITLDEGDIFSFKGVDINDMEGSAADEYTSSEEANIEDAVQRCQEQPREECCTLSSNCCCLDDALDASSFPSFAPLLNASQAYAAHSGFRFRNADFEDPQGADETEVVLSEALRHQLLPIIQDFRDRLRSGDVTLVEEFSLAYEIVMMESVRNAMTAAFHQLNLWPPLPPPDIEPDDCAYQDLSAPLPEIAQRLYNEEALRHQDAVNGGGHGLGQRYRQAMTASFLVDFASETRLASRISDTKTDHVAMLRKFHLLVDAWEKETACAIQGVEGTDRSAVAVASTSNFALQALRWWPEPFTESFWMATSTVFIGAAATAGIMLVKQSKQSKMKLEKLVCRSSPEEVEESDIAICKENVCKDQCLTCPQQHRFD